MQNQFNPYAAIGNAAFEAIRPEKRTAGGSLLSGAGSGMLAVNPLVGGAMMLGGAAIDAYSYKPEAINIEDTFSSDYNPTYTLGNLGEYTSQIEDYSKFGNILTGGRNKARKRRAERETRRNFEAAQGRFNTSAGSFFDRQDTMKEYRSLLSSELGMPTGNYFPV